MPKKGLDLTIIGGIVGLAVLAAWYFIQLPSVVDDGTGRSEANSRRAADAEAVVATQSATNPALPGRNNPLSEQDYTWQQLLRRDSIKPIYNPTFTSAAEAAYDDRELVIGVALNGEAKAYPIGPLNGREMVNDLLGGVPILVTW